MDLEKLYKEYGELMVQYEVQQGRINSIKQAIAQELQKQEKSVKPKVETKA